MLRTDFPAFSLIAGDLEGAAGAMGTLRLFLDPNRLPGAGSAIMTIGGCIHVPTWARSRGAESNLRP